MEKDLPKPWLGWSLDEMKIYIVYPEYSDECSGSIIDIDHAKVFSNKEKATMYMNISNAKLLKEAYLYNNQDDYTFYMREFEVND